MILGNTHTVPERFSTIAEYIAEYREERMLTYLGHSAFELNAGGNSILIDPFISDNPVCKHTPDDFSPHTILLTHAHNDHVGDTVEIARRSGATVITIVELADYLEMQGVSVVATNHGGSASFSGGTVKFVPAWHSSSFTTLDGNVAPGVPAGLVVRFAGKTIYFAGDTALFSDMRLIGEEGLDIAVLPIGDLFTMGPDDAVRATQFLKPSIVIPCHYNTFDALTQDVATFKERVESETSATCLIIAPGDSCDL
jgi:L-ascorbate metabolism protein UlaG (beta-lactamase superfamily)